MREGFLRMLIPAQAFFLESDAEEPAPYLLLPVGEPLLFFFFLAEELNLHLLEFAAAEDEVARVNLVAEALADLGDAEGHLHTGGRVDFLEVDEDGLARF